MRQHFGAALGLDHVAALHVIGGMSCTKTANGNKGQIAHRFLIYTLSYTVRYVLGCDSDCQHRWALLTLVSMLD